MHFAQKGRLLWTRHEALAEVADALVLPLPAAGNPNAPAPQPALSLIGHITLNGLVLKARALLCPALASSTWLRYQILHFVLDSMNGLLCSFSFCGRRRGV